MTDALNLISTALIQVERIFEVLFNRLGSLVPYMAGLTVFLVVKFLLLPIVGSMRVGSSDRVKKGGKK